MHFSTSILCHTQEGSQVRVKLKGHAKQSPRAKRGVLLHVVSDQNKQLDDTTVWMPGVEARHAGWTLGHCTSEWDGRS